MSSGDLNRTLEERTLEDVLEAVEEFGSASFGLVAWELLSSEETIEPMWHQAIGQRMLRATGATDLSEPTYQLTVVGRTRLRDLRDRSTAGRHPANSRGQPRTARPVAAGSLTRSTNDGAKPRPVG